VICKDARTLDKCIPIPIVGDFVVGVSHNSNEHIQKDNIGDECRTNEHDPYHFLMGAPFEGINCELS